ncbi:MAG TPA: YbhN family protein [Trebonia sp.]
MLQKSRAEAGAGSAHVPAPGDDGPRSSRTGRGRRLALTFLATAAVAAIVVWQRRTLLQSLHVLSTAKPGWLLVAVAVEAGSLTAFGLSRRTLLRAGGHRVALRSVLAVTYASNALSQSVPFAGTELAVVYSYRQFRRRGLDAATTSWALTVSWICSASGLALLLAAGAITSGATAASAVGFAGAAVYLLPVAGILLALRFSRVRAVLHAVLASLAAASKRVFGKPEHGADGLEAFLDEVSHTTLPLRGYAWAFGMGLANWVLDCAALAAAIAAMGEPVPWTSLLLVYGAGAAVGSTGVTPGGFLLVELAMSAALTAAGLPSSKAVAAVLAYRVVNYWLVLLGGWSIMLVLTHPVRPRRRRD